MAFSIVRNCGGVSGLHVALNVFSEEMEQRLFAISGPDAPEDGQSGEKFLDFYGHPYNFPAGARAAAPAAGQHACRASCRWLHALMLPRTRLSRAQSGGKC
jgi:hypothetical protein